MYDDLISCLLQAAERALYHELQVSKGPELTTRCSAIAGVDGVALNNFVNRTLSKMEVSDDEEAD